MPVRRTREDGEEFTRLNVTGHVLAEEMHEALEEFYASEPTKLLLYDMSFAEVWHITPDMVLDFVRRAARLGARRPGGRTAVVAPGDLQFDLSMMSQAFHALESKKVDLRVFRSQEDALSWLTDKVSG